MSGVGRDADTATRGIREQNTDSGDFSSHRVGTAAFYGNGRNSGLPEFVECLEIG
ncbi:MAG: hypothetical protein H0X49_17995 [Acidobacteria bacterium]|jgi:hypothetical protein|nr:hypothetical protein [Acidobacteriota bacterium]